MTTLVSAAMILLFGALSSLSASQPFYDRTHYSEVFQALRNYRVFLPPGYETGEMSYPVIYYFHGFNDRYTLELYDGGTVTVPEITEFVSKNPVIVVALDGYVAEHYTDFYRGSPWGILEAPGDHDFGPYFLEFVNHIDRNYRTVPDRRHRGTCGLSMGGFMSLYLSARYPDRVGSSSSYNPGAEFYVGPSGRTVLWRPKDHTSSHHFSWVRLIRASGDHIGQYHQELRDVYAREEQVKFEYRQDEFHKHAVTSIAETFDFHMRAFADPALDREPLSWNYASPFASFDVWEYEVRAPGAEKALVYLTSVGEDGMRVSTRRWAPDGPPLVKRQIRIKTPPLYVPGETYTLLDHDLTGQFTEKRAMQADRQGSFEFSVDGAGHQLSFVGPGIERPAPILLPITRKDKLYLTSGKEISLPLHLYNPGLETMQDIELELTTEYPTVEIIKGQLLIEALGPGDRIDASEDLRIRATGGQGYFAPASLQLQIRSDGGSILSEKIDVNIVPDLLPAPAEVRILDGRTVTFRVFRQAGNQGGGSSIERTVTEGCGDGDGTLEPGEEATIWLKMPQGMDPFDKNNWYRCKVRFYSQWLEEVADLQEPKEREWTGAKYRTSVIRLAPTAPAGIVVPLLLENQTWSFHYTPDVRYGKETLYQAFQFHRHHLHRHEVIIPEAGHSSAPGNLE